MTMLKPRTVGTAIAAILAGLAISAHATAETQRIDIPAGSLLTALEALAKQANIDLVYQDTQVQGFRTNGVTGELPAQDAVMKLLEGTPLKVRRDETSGAILITVPAVSAPVTSSFSSSQAGEAERQAQYQQRTEIEVIVVTAQKREERLLDVPFAVSAIRAEKLSTSGAVRLEDYVATVPGVSVANSTAGGVQTQIVFRGITTGAGGNPVASVYVNDTPITSATQLGSGGSFPDFDPTDLEGIEFLRGPQGTLYGAASLGGLLKFVTRKPDFDRFSARTEIGFTGADHGEAGGGGRLRINAPLSSTVALTASGFYRIDPGFIDNTLSGEADVNTSHARGGRAALAVRPSENVTVEASIMHQLIDSDSTATIDTETDGTPLDGDLKISRPPGSSALKQRFTLYGLSVNADLQEVGLVSDSSYSVQESGAGVDYTKIVGGLLDSLSGQPAGTLGAKVYQPFSTKKFSQEVRLQSTGDGVIGWQVGGFYTFEDATSYAFIDPILRHSGAAASASLGLPVLGDATIDAEYRELAGFGSITLDFTSQLSVSAGLRYSHIKLSSDQSLAGIFLGTGTQSGSASDNQLTYSLNPVYKINPDLMVYGRVASGYRPGGPNILTDDPASYDPDTVVSYEIGTKGALFDSVVTIDLSAFLINWNDIQIQQTQPGANGGPPVNYIGNIGEARSRGMEAAIMLKPFDGLSFDGNIAYTDAYFRNSTSIARAGERLPTSARWQGQIGSEYRFSFQSAWDGFFGASYRYVGRRLGEFTGSPGVARFDLPSYETVDLRAGIEKGGLEVSTYLRNVTDERGYTGSFGFGPYATVGLLQPRTVGLTLAKSFQ